MLAAVQGQWSARRVAGQTLPPAPCIRLDSRTVALPGWQDGDDRWLLDPVTESFIRIGPAGAELVAAPGDGRARLALLALVREILTAGIAMRRPVVDLHAAACARDGWALAIAGRKEAGKTSLLCHLLMAGGVAHMSNDRVFVEPARDGTMASGIPTVTSIRPGTVQTFPQVLARAEEFPAAARFDAEAPVGDAAPLMLTPARFAGRLDVTRLGRAPLHAILLPEITPGIDGWQVERVPPALAPAMLRPCLYGPAADRDRSTLFSSLSGVPVEGGPSMGDRLALLSSQVAVYRCRLGPQAYARPAVELWQALGWTGGEA